MASPVVLNALTRGGDPGYPTDAFSTAAARGEQIRSSQAQTQNQNALMRMRQEGQDYDMRVGDEDRALKARQVQEQRRNSDILNAAAPVFMAKDENEAAGHYQRAVGYLRQKYPDIQAPDQFPGTQAVFGMVAPMMPPELAQKIYEKRFAQTPQQPTNDMQEFEFAKQQGFTGDFMAYQAAKQRAGKNAPDPYYQPVQTSTGLFRFNARTGAYEAMSQDGRPLMPPSIDAGAQGAVAREKEKGKGEGERANAAAIKVRDSNDAIGLLDEVDQLLPNATGSGVGAAMDAAGAVVGATPNGAAEADQLDILAGMLTSKVPRMEGPQSNLDVQLYRQMAGDLGNRKLPVQRRMAAAQRMRDLAMKYADINPEYGRSVTAPAQPKGGWSIKKLP